MCAFLSIIVIASCGHSLAHRPQPTHKSLLTSICEDSEPDDDEFPIDEVILPFTFFDFAEEVSVSFLEKEELIWFIMPSSGIKGVLQSGQSMERHGTPRS